MKGGSGTDFIENDAKNGVVIDGSGHQDVVLPCGAGAKATLGIGAGNMVAVGLSGLSK